ncbi:hypothetical protein B0A55_08996 [Friedmanniomyces simplex]|uniref:Uncharacterized protein n=1 Tax=Friedmanniomyces simplex TaxID=329884 RepID=A0A4U0X0I6_9PEZI|nr:hypothetical protein B0A55_08996 [Friedmanniomyces simplex]
MASVRDAKPKMQGLGLPPVSGSGRLAAVMNQLARNTDSMGMTIEQRKAAAPTKPADTLQIQLGVPVPTHPSTATQVQSPKPAMKKDSITAPTCDQYQANVTGVTARAAADSIHSPDASAAKKRKAAAVTGDVEDEEELRDQLVEIELKERRIEVRRKLRELGRKRRGVGGVVDG